MSEWDSIMADLHDVKDIKRAVGAYGRLDRAADETWLPRLHQLLAMGRNFFVREAAAYPIARLEGLQALPQLLHALKLGEDEGHDNDGLVCLIEGLVETNQEQVGPLLVRMIGASSGRQRSDAAWLWGFASDVLDPDPLLNLVEDPNPRVRSAAVGSLGSYKGREEVFTSLTQALNDPDESVRYSAASALGFYQDQRAVPLLRELLKRELDQVRRIVAYALEQLAKTR